MTYLLQEIDHRGVCTLTLNRPDKHNCFDDSLIAAMTAAFKAADADDKVRIIVLTGKGKSFSSGADLNWMKSMVAYSEEENYRDSMDLANLMRTIYDCKKPTVAKVNGHVFGGGIGLVACCDIAIGSERGKYALSEAKLGLAPAAISPFVIQAIGVRNARRYFLTAETFTATKAHALGLLHEVVALDDLDTATDEVINDLLACGPDAQQEAKALIKEVNQWQNPAADDLTDKTVRLIAKLRVSDEGQERLKQFLNK